MSQYISRLGGTRVAPRIRFPGGFAGGTASRAVSRCCPCTPPLHQPGTGDAGGMNVYIVELARRLAAIGIEVEIFTRATTGALPPRWNWRPVSSSAMSTRDRTRVWPRRNCPPSSAPSPTG